MSVATGGHGGGSGGGGGGKPPPGGGHGDDHDDIIRNLRRALRRDNRALRALAALLGMAPAPVPAPVVPAPAPGPVVQTVMMADNGGSAGFATVNDAVTTLRTGGFAGCFGIILLGAGNTRSIAHINSWHWPQTHGQIWNNLAAFQALAATAHTAHVYHWLGTWAQGDGSYGDQFIAYFNLGNLNVVVHGNADPISVDPAGNVTP
jgi:hypothetical protein